LLTYSVNDGTVPSYFLFNLSGSYDFKWFNLDKLQVFATVDNLFDKDPPFSAGAVGGANAVFFDALEGLPASGCAWRSNKTPPPFATARRPHPQKRMRPFCMRLPLARCFSADPVRQRAAVLRRSFATQQTHHARTDLAVIVWLERPEQSVTAAGRCARDAVAAEDVMVEERLQAWRSRVDARHRDQAQEQTGIRGIRPGAEGIPPVIYESVE